MVRLLHELPSARFIRQAQIPGAAWLQSITLTEPRDPGSEQTAASAAKRLHGRASMIEKRGPGGCRQ